jgi:hypothetical protein
METRDHQGLKRLAAAFLLSRGCRAVALEVRCPWSRFVLDAAGWLDSRPAPSLGSAREDARAGAWSVGRVKCPAQAIIVECKQSRADFVRDAAERDALHGEQARLRAEVESIKETRIKAREPHLMRLERDLFGAEHEEWDFARSRCAAYHGAVDALARVQRRLREQTKFDELARRALADRLYLLAPAGLVARRDVPEGWGLVEVRRSRLRAAAADPAAGVADDMVIRAEAPELPCDERRRSRLLRNVAFAATGAWVKREGALGVRLPANGGAEVEGAPRPAEAPAQTPAEPL